MPAAVCAPTTARRRSLPAASACHALPPPLRLPLARHDHRCCARHAAASPACVLAVPVWERRRRLDAGAAPRAGRRAPVLDRRSSDAAARRSLPASNKMMICLTIFHKMYRRPDTVAMGSVDWGHRTAEGAEQTLRPPSR
ncbi:hypothetical protein PVAP13_9NG064385 [Panicum virgatum]|uniref:Uncharacterized protein n=1 Tax=Panicum virgatum TaxID=38727 RepID=A0A8T0MDW8_PANVG|nr:hypothetical protein PVAP13_9NG064385 [Panicum virgatum]